MSTITLRSGQKMASAEYDQILAKLKALHDKDLFAFNELVRVWRNCNHQVPERYKYVGYIDSFTQHVLRNSELPVLIDDTGHGTVQPNLAAVLQDVISFRSRFSWPILDPRSNHAHHD